MPLENGSVAVCVPIAASDWDLLHFAWHLNSQQGRESEVGAYDYRRQEESLVGNSLTQAPDTTGIFRGSSIADRSRPPLVLSGLTTATLTHNYRNNVNSDVRSRTEVYYLLKEPRIENAISAYKSVEQMPLLGAITSVPEADLSPEPLQEVNRDLLQRWAKSTKVILLSAYGGDATLIWTKREDI